MGKALKTKWDEVGGPVRGRGRCGEEGVRFMRESDCVHGLLRCSNIL